jgi:CBS domain-containing protein
MKNNLKEHSANILNVNSTIVDAKTKLEDKQYDNLIVEDESNFIGIITKTDFLNADENLTFDDLRDELHQVYLREDFTLFDWLKIISNFDISNFPIVADDETTLIGSIDTKNVLKKFEHTGLNVESSIVLIIKKPSIAFSYSEVFQIAEANNAKIFGSYINNSNEEETEIVLNLYHMGLNELLQSYRRYEYDIVSYHVEDLHHETIKANSEYFSKYLTV